MLFWGPNVYKMIAQLICWVWFKIKHHLMLPFHFTFPHLSPFAVVDFCSGGDWWHWWFHRGDMTGPLMCPPTILPELHESYLRGNSHGSAASSQPELPPTVKKFFSKVSITELMHRSVTGNGSVVPCNTIYIASFPIYIIRSTLQ